MINYSESTIQHIIIHKVGNKSRDEGVIISAQSTPIDEGMADLLTHYFLKPFTKVTETFQFVQAAETERPNTLQNLTNSIFENSTTAFYENSVAILKHLYEQSNHPHIKTGDLFIVFFKDILLDDELTNAIGIFKAESKEDFLKVAQDAQQLFVQKELGIGLRKLDKGCLILNAALDDGAKVLSVDNNSYDADYWLYRFLDVEFVRDNNFVTRSYVEMVQSYAEEVVKDKGGKKEELDFLNQSVQYLDTNERMSTDDFRTSLFKDEESKDSFEAYVSEYEAQNGLELSENFLISKSALQKQKRAIKNYINLDTNIQIKLDFRNPESSQHFLEKGFDEGRDMSYYKVYFNEELD